MQIDIMWIFKHSQRLIHVPSLLQFTFFFAILEILIEKGKISQSLQLLSQWIFRYNSYWQAVQGRVFIFENAK